MIDSAPKRRDVVRSSFSLSTDNMVLSTPTSVRSYNDARRVIRHCGMKSKAVNRRFYSLSSLPGREMESTRSLSLETQF